MVILTSYDFRSNSGIMWLIFYTPEEMELHISWPLKCNQSILCNRSFIILKLSFTDQWYFLNAPLRYCVHTYILHLYTQFWHIKTLVLLQSKLFVQFYPKICGKGDVACTYGRSDQLEVDCELMMSPFGIDVKTVIVFCHTRLPSSSLELNICCHTIL